MRKLALLFLLRFSSPLCACIIVSGPQLRYLRHRPARCASAADCIAACESGLGEACLFAADRLAENYSGDLDLVVPGYRRACDLGEDAGCYNAGRLLNPEDEEAARVSWETGCLMGGSLSCLALGKAESRSLDKEHPGPVAERKAADETVAGLRGLAADCDAGQAWACDWLRGEAEENDPARPELLARAQQARLESCALDDDRACEALAWHEHEAGTVEESEAAESDRTTRTRDWFAREYQLALPRCLNDDDDDACDRAGFALQQRTEDDDEQPDAEIDGLRTRAARLRRTFFRDLLERLCGQGSAPACERAGETEWAAANWTEAGRYFSMACANGRPGACLALADLTADTGRGVPAAIALYEKACAIGGCRALAMRFGSGIGVPVNRWLAWDYFERGCRAGDTHACDAMAPMQANPVARPNYE